ncbi:MAG: CHAT domain-containing protein [Xenococcus sp. (in: cyanobacteria)]
MAKRTITIIQMSEHFLYLPVYYALEKGFVQEYLDEKYKDYKFDILSPSKFTEKWTIQQPDTDQAACDLLLDALGEREVHFAIADPTEMEKKVHVRKPVILAALVTNTPFWVIHNQKNNPILQFHDLTRFKRIIAYKQGTTSYAIAARIFNLKNSKEKENNIKECTQTIQHWNKDLDTQEKKQIINKIIEDKDPYLLITDPGNELDILRAQPQDTAALSPNILEALKLSKELKFCVDYMLGYDPDFYDILVTAIITHNEVCNEYRNLIIAFLKGVQKAIIYIDYYRENTRKIEEIIEVIMKSQARSYTFISESNKAYFKNALKSYILNKGIYQLDFQIIKPQWLKTIYTKQLAFERTQEDKEYEYLKNFYDQYYDYQYVREAIKEMIYEPIIFSGEEQVRDGINFAQDHTELIEILLKIPEMDSEEGRKKILTQANLDKFIKKMKLSGASNHAVVGDIVNCLYNLEQLEKGGTALGKLLLFAKKNSVIEKDRKVLDKVISEIEPGEEVMNDNQNSIKYKDFEMLITNDCNIRASSDRGEERGEFLLDMSEIELAIELIEERKTKIKFLKSFGSKLYQALFPTNIHGHLQGTIADAEAENCGVRLRLVFEAPKLVALPWEFLYDQRTNTFLGNNTQTVLSRYIDVPLKPQELIATSLPLKVLLVISSPTDLVQLDADGEENLIREALEKYIEAGQIELDVLREATIKNINQKLREKSYNVFHFIGHGVFKNDQGFIALVNQDGTAKLLSDEKFADFFLGNRSLGLAVLNSCQGAAASDNKIFTGIAPNLVRRGIPAVVAMQYSIFDTTAKLFSDEFYRTIALGWPVDAAIQTTRNAISMEVEDDSEGRDFATPVLYMRAKDGIIFTAET